MRNILILVALAVVIATSAYAYTTGEWRCISGACTLGATTTLSTQVIGGAESLSVGATNDTVTLTVDGTDTAVFLGADAATPATTTFDTTGAGTVNLGSADVIAVAVVTGVGTITVGTANTTATTVTTDGGSVVLDGSVVTDEYIQGDVGPFIALDSGALTANTTHLAGAAASYTMPVCETANIGQWVTVVVKDVSEVVVIEPLTGDTRHPAGVIIAVSEFMDSAGAATSDGDYVTFVCITADNWYSTAIGGACIDGGAS